MCRGAAGALHLGVRQDRMSLCSSRLTAWGPPHAQDGAGPPEVSPAPPPPPPRIALCRPRAGGQTAAPPGITEHRCGDPGAVVPAAFVCTPDAHGS